MGIEMAPPIYGLRQNCFVSSKRFPRLRVCLKKRYGIKKELCLNRAKVFTRQLGSGEIQTVDDVQQANQFVLFAH